METEFPDNPKFELCDDEKFFANAFIDDEGHYVVEVSTGCVANIEELWKLAWPSAILIDDEGNRVLDIDGSKLTMERLIHLSLSWLVLHELMHIRLGHLELLDVASLVETENCVRNDASPKNILAAALNEHLEPQEKPRLRPCLELQADNEATEIMFGTYGESEWGRFRIEASAIFVVMALMERAEETLGLEESQRTYPKVATRFFTLFAQLFQYWLYPGAELDAGDGETFVRTARKPEGEDFQRYMKFVLALTVNDIVQIALWAQAKTFLIDLGEDAGLFKDLFEIQYAPNLSKAKLATNAARQWRELLPVNEKVMAVSGLRN